MHVLTRPLLIAILPRLTVSIATLAWLWTSASERVRRGQGPLEPDDRWSAALVWSAVALTATALLLGTVGRLAFYPWCVAVALSAGLMRLPDVGRGAAGAAVESGGNVDDAGGGGAPARDTAPPSAWFLILLGGYLAGRALFALRNPPWDLDSLDYHLPMLAHWMSSGALGVALHHPSESATYYPGNTELLQLWTVWSAGRDTFVHWPGIFAIALMAVAARRLALEMGARRAAAEGLTLAYATAAGIAGLTKGLQSDAYLAAWLAVALRFGLRFRREHRSADFVVMLMALALACGTRFTGPAFAAAVLALVLLVPGRWVSPRWPRVSPAWWLLAALIGGFWMARNLIACGNPLFPVETGFGPLHLPGILPQAILARTTQLAVWREGYSGQLTFRNLNRFFGIPLNVIGIGVLLWMIGRLRTPRLARADREWPILVSFALATFGLYLVSIYSGVNWPPIGSRPAVLTVANVRYLMPGVVALMPLAALGFSGSALLAIAFAMASAALSMLQLRALLSHIVPGLIGAAVLLAALRITRGLRRRSNLAPIVLVPALGVALTIVTAVTDAGRNRVYEQVWDDYRGRIRVLPGALATEVRTRAAGRPVACVGLHTVYQISGRDFSGRPVYAPVGIPWRAANDSWKFALDDRDHPSHDRWLRNLDASRAALIVVAAEDSRVPPIEATWCAADTLRFPLVARAGSDAVYEIRHLPEY